MGLLNRTYSRERMLLYMHLRAQSHSVQEGNRQNVRPSVAHFETLRDAPSQSSHEMPASSTQLETPSMSREMLSDVASETQSDAPLTDEDGFLVNLGAMHMLPMNMPGFHLMQPFAKMIEQRGYEGYALNEVPSVFRIRFKRDISADVLNWIPYFPRIVLLGDRVASAAPYPSALKYYHMLMYFVVKVVRSPIRLVDFPLAWMRTYEGAFSLNAFMQEFHPEATLEEFALLVGFPRLQTVFFNGYLYVRLTEEATSMPFPCMKEVLLPPKAFPPHLIGNRIGLQQKYWEEDALKRMDAEENENRPPTNGHTSDNAKQEAQRKSPTPQQCDVPRHYASGEQRIGGARGAVPLYSVAFCTCNCSDPYCMLQILRPGQVQPQEQQYQYQQKQQELEMRQQQLQMRLPVRPKAVYHHSHVDRVIPGKHVCIANDVAYVYPGEHGMSVCDDDSCANYFSTNPLGRNIMREQCSQRQQHERQIPLKECPLSPLSQDSDEELLARGNIDPPQLAARDPTSNLRNVVFQELSASEWTSIDDLVLQHNVMAAWMVCGRHPLWELLKPFTDFVQEKDPQTMYWMIKRADPEDIKAELSEKPSSGD
eukprot:GEMP01021050.1.p1 GENE.GEMP01021050.1~~GEMP01021050.1.p1  ORF type:complete len:595 (-),score=128.64 GEMP01021050.1:703-2487(-)